MKLLVTGALKLTNEEMNRLRSIAGEVVFLQDERFETDMDVSDFEAVICNSLFVNNDVERFKKLEYIQLTSAGTDRVPMDKITNKGITLHTARGVYSIPMAEWALCKALDFAKGTLFFAENQKKKKWEKNRSLTEIYGKNVCIVGFGSIGAECAKRFSAFGCHVTAVDVYPVPLEYAEEYVNVSMIKTALEKADITVLTLPLTSDTKGLFNKDVLSCLKDGSLIINIARGGLINEEELAEALGEKRFFAALDVFSQEPLDENSPLWELDNVYVSPHNSFVSDGNDKRLKNLIFENLETFVERRVEGFEGMCSHKHS